MATVSDDVRQAMSKNRRRDGAMMVALAVDLGITLFLLFDRMGW